jgi:hypothetical protein
MRFISKLSLVLGLALLSSCGDGGEEEELYADLQDCFDDHTGPEGLSIEESIVICMLDHPEVGGADFDTAEQCVAFVDVNLDEASATLEEIEAACDEYIVQKDM